MNEQSTLWWIIGVAVVLLIVLFLVSRMQRGRKKAGSDGLVASSSAGPAASTDAGLEPAHTSSAATQDLDDADDTRDIDIEPVSSSPSAGPADGPNSADSVDTVETVEAQESTTDVEYAPTAEDLGEDSPAAFASTDEPADLTETSALSDTSAGSRGSGSSVYSAEATPAQNVSLEPDQGPAHDPDREFFGEDDDVHAPGEIAPVDAEPQVVDIVDSEPEQGLYPVGTEPAVSNDIRTVDAFEVQPQDQFSDLDPAGQLEVPPADPAPFDAPEPFETVEPVEPVESLDPVEPGGSLDPVEPGGSLDPVEPGGSLDPVEPVATEDVVEPPAPLDPAVPTSQAPQFTEAPVVDEPAVPVTEDVTQVEGAVPPPSAFDPEPAETAEPVVLDEPTAQPQEVPEVDALSTDPLATEADPDVRATQDVSPHDTEAQPPVGTDTTGTAGTTGTANTTGAQEEAASPLERLNAARERVQAEAKERWTTPDSSGETPQEKVSKLRDRVESDVRGGIRKLRNRKNGQN
ncbi:hypothetical protein ACMYYO_08390 [Dermacoccaceae bacterium W4C1]